MRTVVDAAVLPADDDVLDRLRIEGPTVRLSPSAALSLALLLHELATNATKYGSLSVQGGRPLVIWNVDAHPRDRASELHDQG